MDLNWKSQWYPAPPALEGVLAGIWSVHAAPAAELAARVLPDGSTCLTFQRDQTILRAGHDRDAWAAACVSGPRSGAFDFQLSAAGRMLIVQLRPAGAQQVLGVPMNELANRVEPLEAVIGQVATQLEDCLLGDTDDAGCVRAIEQWLAERVWRQPCRSKRTDALVQEVARHVDRLRVDQLARHVDLSRRHLSRLMHERCGFLDQAVRPHLAVRPGRADQPCTPNGAVGANCPRRWLRRSAAPGP